MDADALRDDIATNVIPAINNNLADVQAKVNGILAALRGVGIVANYVMRIRRPRLPRRPDPAGVGSHRRLVP